MTERVNSLVACLLEKSKINSQNTIDFFRNHFLDYQDIEGYCSWSAGAYTRNLIHRTNEFELVLLCWDSGAASPLHDHGGHLCAMRIIDGYLAEKTLTKNDASTKLNDPYTYKTGDVSVIDYTDRIHSLYNQSNTERAISLHLYMPPIDICGIYSASGEQIETKTLTYTTERSY